MLHKNYINGEWLEGTAVSKNINPSDVTDVVGEYAQADAKQAEDAIAAAKAALPGWSGTTPQQRADILETIGVELLARRDEIGTLLAREEGKPKSNGIAETMRAAQIFKFFAQETLRIEGTQVASVRPNVDVTITREPVGVVGLICPWNFPIAIPAWKIAPALGLWQHGGVQACRSGTGFGLGADGDCLTRRVAQRCFEPCHGARFSGRPGVSDAQGRKCNFLHGLG